MTEKIQEMEIDIDDKEEVVSPGEELPVLSSRGYVFKIKHQRGRREFGLTTREERVVPLALEYDKLDNEETTPEQWNQHYLNCLQAECKDMAKRALKRKLESER